MDGLEVGGFGLLVEDVVRNDVDEFLPLLVGFLLLYALIYDVLKLFVDDGLLLLVHEACLLVT